MFMNGKTKGKGERCKGKGVRGKGKGERGKVTRPSRSCKQRGNV